MSHELTRYLSYLLLNEKDLLLMAITWKQMYPNQLVEKPTNIYSHELSFLVDNQSGTTRRVLYELGVTYSAVFYIREFEQDDFIAEQNCTTREESAFCYLSRQHQNEKEDEEENKKQCIKEIFLDFKNKTQLNASIDFVKSHENLRAIYIYGLHATYQLLENQPQFLNYWNKGEVLFLAFVER